MKKSQTIRELLGFTQTEMALALNVSRHQYIRYETGTGKILVAATYLIAEMLGHIQTSKKAMQPSTFVKEQVLALQQELQRSLKENEYQQLRTVRRIGVVEKVYATKMQVLELVEFLSLRDENKEMAPAVALRTIARNADISLKGQNLAALSKLKLRLELLQLEKLLLDTEMLKIMLNTDFIDTKK